MPAFRPMLPPRPGYVEVEVNGERQYKKIETEQDKQMNEYDNLLIDLTYRTTLLELGVM